MEDSSKASYAWSTAEVAWSGGEGAMKLWVVELRDKVETKELWAFIDSWIIEGSNASRFGEFVNICEREKYAWHCKSSYTPRIVTEDGYLFLVGGRGTEARKGYRRHVDSRETTSLDRSPSWTCVKFSDLSLNAVT
jgi:hypothetical protein